MALTTMTFQENSVRVKSVAFGAPFVGLEDVHLNVQLHEWTDNFLTFVNDSDPVPRLLNLVQLLPQLMQDAAGITRDFGNLMKGLHEESTPKQLSNVLEMLQLALPQCDTALRSSLFRGIIQVAARLNNTSLLMQAFRQMRDQHVLPTSNDFQIVIYSLAQQGSISECAIVWQYVRNQNDASVVAIFTAVMEDFSKKEKVEGMICAFQSLRDAVADASSDGQKDPEGKESHALLQQCRAALMQAASRKQHSSPAFRRLLELAPEHGLSPEALMVA